MNNIKFSIIIPSFNCEMYIENTLNSIFNQDYSNYEVLVIDDCSTDNTYNLLQNIKNIKLFKTHHNLKQGAARNIGLLNCSGDYILFLDADDTFSNNRVLSMLHNEIINSSLPDIIYTGLQMVGIRELILLPTKENTKKSYRLGENPFINVTTMCMKNSLIKNNSIVFPENIKYEDVYFAFRAIEASSSYSHVSEITYIYNNRSNTSTTANSFSQVQDTVKLIELLVSLKDSININNLPFLKKRIEQQYSRLLVRLSRVIDTNLNKKI